MPFPLAHPAAVVPLKRFCPKWLSLPALIVGSISPDLGYCFGPLKVDEFSHLLAGTFVFCVPAGLLVLWVFYRMRARVMRILPTTYQAPLQRLCSEPPVNASVIISSLLFGAWTHILLDAFTHKQGWFVINSPLLRTPVGSFLGHKVRIFHVLWYLSSFAGVGWLFLIFDRWVETNRPLVRSRSLGIRLGRALLIATLTLLPAPIHHLAANWLLLYATGLLSVIIVLTVAAQAGWLAKTSE